MPGSLNCDAIVAITGICSTGRENCLWFRWYCFRTSRSASSAPRLSNLLSATTSAKSSMSIFSSCVGAPKSGVITYSETSEWSTISVSDCPIPEVSRITRSKPATLRIDEASRTCPDNARFAWRVASERMYTRGSLIEFMRIRSPSSAPPVFRLVGSTEMMPIVRSGWSIRKRRTSSSTSDDLPAPPVPVMPRTGTFVRAASARIPSSSAACSSRQFSAAEISRAIEPASRRFAPSSSACPTSRPIGRSLRRSRSLIIPCSPIARPSSGVYTCSMPYACRSAISCGRITPPPPANIRISSRPASFKRSCMYFRYST